jgi:hypothetical protein
MGGTGTTAYPHRRRPIDYGLPTRAATRTCGSGGIRVLHPDDANGGWCGFTGAGNTNSVRNLDVDKVGAADSLTQVVMVIVIIVVERIKSSKREEVDAGQLKWAVDKSKRNVKAMRRQLEEGNPYSSDKSKKVACARSGRRPARPPARPPT